MDLTKQEFSAEIEERIEQLFAALDELRNSLNDGPARRELLDRVFRHTHNIKGSAAAIGLQRVNQIAHELENLLSSVRSGRVALDEATLNSFEEVAQLLLDEPAGAERVIPKFELPKKAAESAGRATTALPAELLGTLTEEERWNLTAAVNEGGELFIVTTGFDVQDFEEQFRQLQERLKERGEIVSSSPTIAPEYPSRINFRIVYVSKVDLTGLRSEFERPPNVSLTQLTAPEQAKTPVKQILEVPANLIQVRLDDLDRVASTAHSLFVETTQTLQTISSGREGSEVDLVETVRQKFMNLEREIIELRMVQIGRMLQRAVRAGRTAARASQKNVDFEVLGNDIQMDKLLVNAISDPLIHLVRNAVDHGIESEDERTMLGKGRRGVVKIEVVRDGGQYIAKVSDDGRGVNPESIERAALKLGIVADRGVFDLEQSLRLIFRPGFSSAPAVSRVSGRGVGLDVVETAVELAGGEVRVSSELNKGTIFEIILPVSFGLLDSVVVRVGDNHYCLDAGLISNCERFADNQFEKGQPLDDESLSIQHLRALLGQPLNEPGQAGQVVRCQLRQESNGNGKSGLKQLGLMVDAVEGVEEVLVRGLGSHGGRWRGVAGATELRNGTVALVLDLPRLLRLRG